MPAEVLNLTAVTFRALVNHSPMSPVRVEIVLINANLGSLGQPLQYCPNAISRQQRQGDIVLPEQVINASEVLNERINVGVELLTSCCSL